MARSRDYSTDSNSRRLLDHSSYIGFVKRTDDAQRMGRISVWIPELGGDKTKEASWIIVGYASPFAGATNPNSISKQNTTAEGSQTSYGMWMTPPDLENEVLVTFVNGDIARGYYFGCILQQNMNHMLPGIASDTSNDPALKAKGILPPVVEYNKVNTPSTDTPPRPTFTPLATGLSKTGLVRDYERGPASTSARRESPSKAFGIATPRSNSFTMDDNEANEFIRLRTRSGAQILIHETTGYVYINTKGGSAWLELSDAGIDIYSENSVSIRAEKDFNVRADGNIVLDAGAAINFRAGTDITMQSGQSIQIGSGTNIVMAASGGTLSLGASSNVLLKADGNFITQSEGITSMKAGGNFLRTAPAIFDNGPPAATVPEIVPTGPIGKKAPDVQDGKNSTVDTITHRMPSHEPWSGHPKPNLPPPSAPASLAEIAGRPGQGSNMPPQGVPATQQVQTGDGMKTVLMDNDGTKCALGVGTKTASTQVYNAIQVASDAHGIPFGTMMAMADVESAFNPSAGSGLSSAKGNFQFISGTWSSMVSKYGAKNNVSTDPSEIFNPVSNAALGAEYINENKKLLQSKGITNPTPGALYSLHLLGGGGGSAFIAAAQSNPDAPLSSVLPATTIANNPLWFKGKATVGDAYNNIEGIMNAKASAYSKQAGLPAPCDRNGATGADTTASSGVSSTGQSNPITGNLSASTPSNSSLTSDQSSAPSSSGVSPTGQNNPLILQN